MVLSSLQIESRQGSKTMVATQVMEDRLTASQRALADVTVALTAQRGAGERKHNTSMRIANKACPRVAVRCVRDVSSRHRSTQCKRGQNEYIRCGVPVNDGSSAQNNYCSIDRLRRCTTKHVNRTDHQRRRQKYSRHTPLKKRSFRQRPRLFTTPLAFYVAS